jgi:hypothetical protein
MIGRLLQSAASTFAQQGSSRPSTPLESVTEETHTRDLLYPELNALRISQHNGLSLQGGRHLANAREAADFDDRGGLDMAFPSDIRIIIAQDTTPRHQLPQILYDSKSLENSSLGSDGPGQDAKAISNKPKTAYNPVPSPARRHHTPNSSIFQSSHSQSFLPTSPRAESRYRPLSGDVRSRASPFNPPSNEFESTQARLLRESYEDTEALLACMFGATGPYKEPGTKLHMLPRKFPDGIKRGNNTPTTARPFSAGGSNRRRTPLASSTSAADFYNEGSGEGSRLSSRPSVMCTRLFSVQTPEIASTDDPFNPGDSNYQPAPLVETPLPPQASKTVQQKKYPMYAVAIILQLPMTRARSHVPYHALSSLGSSFNDVTPAASWNTDHSFFSRYMDLRGSGSTMEMTPLVSSQLSYILEHWSIITRTLEQVENCASNTMRYLLGEATPWMPLILAPPVRQGATTKQKEGKEPTQQSVYVLPGCLQNDPRIRKACETVGQRIVGGLRTRRVLTGQGRWGAWREEARWVERWAGGRDQNFFFFNILTAFLGHHTSWLDSYTSSVLRDRHVMHPRTAHQGAVRLPQRTIIVATDKMAARRLIFLLAAFLPSAPISVYPSVSQSPYPAMPYSESPSSMPVASERTLRRTESHKSSGFGRGITARDCHSRSVSFSILGAGGTTEQHEVLMNNGHNRRTSDTRSSRGSLVVAGSNGHSHRTPLSAVVADSAQPVPYFTSPSMQNQMVPSDRRRPGSSGSLASIALNHTLKRSDSTALSTSGSPGRWGSMVSSFWSNRRVSSTDDSEAFSSEQDGSLNHRGMNNRRPGKLAQMVEEASAMESDNATRVPGPSIRNNLKPIVLEDALRTDIRGSQPGSSAARSIPTRPRIDRLPLKLSYNEDDGFLDVEMPFISSVTSSMESSLASAHTPNHVADSFNEHHSLYGTPITTDTSYAKSEPIPDVAGWLRTFHPDFELQAVRPYEQLREDIKQAMRLEPHPETLLSSADAVSRNDKWQAVCSTLVADTTNYSVQCITLHRRARKAHLNFESTISRESSLQISRDTQYDEKLTEEQVMDMDSTLIDAVERVLAQKGGSSCVPSRNPSPSGATGRNCIRNASRPTSVRETSLTVEPQTVKEVPNSDCKNMVLGALEEVLRSVVAEQKDGSDGREEGGKKRREKGMPDSTLREGIRRWLADVDGF